MNCADTVQDAVTIVDPADDESVYHGVGSCMACFRLLHDDDDDD